MEALNSAPHISPALLKQFETLSQYDELVRERNGLTRRLTELTSETDAAADTYRQQLQQLVDEKHELEAQLERTGTVNCLGGKPSSMRKCLPPALALCTSTISAR